MPRTRKAPPPAAPSAAFDPAALDALLGGRQSAAELDDLFRAMKKALMERVLAVSVRFGRVDASVAGV